MQPIEDVGTPLGVEADQFCQPVIRQHAGQVLKEAAAGGGVNGDAACATPGGYRDLTRGC